MTATQRQRRYRQARRNPDGPPERQVNMVLTDQAVTALARLAAHAGRTRRAVLQDLILSAQRDILDRLTGPEADRYHDSAT